VTLIIDALLWSIVLALAVTAAVRSRPLLMRSLRAGFFDFVRLLPRLLVGVVGSGFIAELLPRHLMATWLGPESGLLGILLATLGGALTPGGPVVGFAIGAAALKGGAGMPQVIAFSTAWALFAVQRLLFWELPVLPGRLVWVRSAAALPLPFLAAGTAMLLGKP
jgi:uncharacterized membrane protein YraQ (UPF0718 family)